ncbi:transporter, partial [Vibrio fortis]
MSLVANMRLNWGACMPWLSRLASLSVVVVLVGLMPDIAGIDPSQAILRARAGAEQLMTAEALTLVFCLISVLFTIHRWQQNKLDNQHNSLSSVLVSLPEYVIASLLILVFAIWLGWFPPYGWTSTQNLWLPTLALALPASGLFSRLLNDSLIRVLDEP